METLGRYQCLPGNSLVGFPFLNTHPNLKRRAKALTERTREVTIMNRTIFTVITRKCVQHSSVVGDAVTSLPFLCVQRPTPIINQRMAGSLRPPGPALQAPRRSTPLPPCTAAPPVTAPAITLLLNQVRVTGAPGIHPESGSG